MLRSVAFHSAAVRSPAFTSSVLTLPIERNRVEMTADGHLVNLLVDTGSSNAYLVYGDWYESIYGVGSCEYLVSGCYFCPPTDPCTPDSLLSRGFHTVGYGSGQVLVFVYREVTLEIAGRNISHFLMGLLINSTRVEEEIQPNAMLGLGLPPPKFDPGFGTTSFVEQLVEAEVLARYIVSIHTTRLSEGITGQLVLGKETKKTEDTASLRLVDLPSTSGAITGVISAVYVTSTSADPAVACHYIHFDTGCDSTIVPSEIFARILEAFEVEFGPDRVNWKKSRRPPPTDEQGLAAYIDDEDDLWFRESVAERLPALVIQADSPSTFKLHLSNHAQVCESGWCRLQVIDASSVNLPPDLFILGRFFFLEYHLTVDLDREIVLLESSKRPLVKEIGSSEWWEESRFRRCKSCRDQPEQD